MTPATTPTLPADRREALAAVKRWVDEVRPGPGEPPCDRIEAFVDALEADETLLSEVRRAVHVLFDDIDAVETLAGAGVLGEETLSQELVARVVRRLVPPVEDLDSLSGVVHHLFPRGGDVQWLCTVNPRCWERLQDALGLRVDPSTPIPRELSVAIRVLAHRIGALGLKPVLTSRVPELSPRGPGATDSPFLQLSDQVLAYIRTHGNGQIADEIPALAACMDTLERCREAVDYLRAHKHRTGTSLELTALSFRMHGLIDRLELLLKLTDPEERGRGQDVARVVADLVRADEDRDRIGLLVKQHADLLVYQVVEHAAKSGRKYITRTRAEYGRFLLSSMGGGLIVAIFALFKVKLAGLDLPLAGQATLYSLNYALCFVLIYMTGATLATKQPAVTAHTLAAALDGPGDTHHLGSMVEMIARAVRSQFASFLGNVAVAFPVGLLLAVLWQQVTGHHLADVDKATRLVTDLHPWQSGSIWYAAVAGFFLFSAGVIAGWVDNRLVYSRVPARIAAHPLLVRILGPRLAARLGKLTDAKAGALTGNVVLGFCLGSAGTLGHILGLPFDIRHIAFSSAHLAMGLHGLDWQLPLPEIATFATGVALIGLINFLVSFGMALGLALESRQLTFREGRQLTRMLLAHFLRRPIDFVFPPRSSSDGPHASSTG